MYLIMLPVPFPFPHHCTHTVRARPVPHSIKFYPSLTPLLLSCPRICKLNCLQWRSGKCWRLLGSRVSCFLFLKYS